MCCASPLTLALCLPFALTGPSHQLALQPRAQAPRAARPDRCRQDLQGAARQGPQRQQGSSFQEVQLEEAQQPVPQALPLKVRARLKENGHVR